MATTGKPAALLLGDMELAPYHPLEAVQDEIRGVVEAEGYTLQISTDYDQLRADSIQAYDLILSYTDCWNEHPPVTREQAAGLLAYVSGGGSLLVLHTGISLQSRHEMSALFGAKFTGHPPFRELSFRVEDQDHPIMQGIDPFSLADEPYEFDFSPFVDTQVLLSYEDGEKRRPAAWAHEFGLGHVVYLMPGHQKEAFQHPMVRKLIANAVKVLSSGE
ncbi:ThuA domain-containing protein [Paenibacillus abyssi]|uniref:ThuA-like domain-containing protein n=1 Tax=Paenibacillus abyssi TaxID=1340531 RepID=A0A917FLK7_9BACL|nr:ThuA domain-containing protein [Paenibacillus abyssi]GGF92488.1 hypothetical protein GCM10010916_07340 [Paenibacillus abyssi]